jgi:DNA-binding transcriptional ArsR family regulator
MRIALDKKLLLQISNDRPEVKEVCVMNNPQKMQVMLGKMSWRILTALSEQEMYPLQLAKHLGIHEQLVYYYIRRLTKAGVITVQREENRKGAVAKYYRTISSAFAVELPNGYKPLRGQPSLLSVNEQVQGFFREFVTENGCFDGKVVVGCPAPHGPFKTSARDGHYAAALTFFLGQFARNPTEFAIKLDTDVKAEKEEKNNLILVGGPWDKTKRIIVVAGNKAVGTKACVLAITNFWSKTLQNYHDGEPFAAVIQGFDLDGDGKVDAIEVPE